MNEAEQFRMQMMNESILQYYMRACGWTFWPIVSVGLAAILFSLFVVIRGRGATVGPALVLSVLITPLLGLLGGVELMTVAFRIIEQSGTIPDASSLCAVCGHGLSTFYVGLMFVVPTGLIALVGSTVRAMTAPATATLP
jgi:hypothetical protein